MSDPRRPYGRHSTAFLTPSLVCVHSEVQGQALGAAHPDQRVAEPEEVPRRVAGRAGLAKDGLAALLVDVPGDVDGARRSQRQVDRLAADT